MTQQARPFGWITFDDYIADIAQQGIIAGETAWAYASERAVVQRGRDQIKAVRGEKTTDIEGLQIDKGYS